VRAAGPRERGFEEYRMLTTHSSRTKLRIRVSMLEQRSDKVRAQSTIQNPAFSPQFKFLVKNIYFPSLWNPCKAKPLTAPHNSTRRLQRVSKIALSLSCQESVSSMLNRAKPCDPAWKIVKRVPESLFVSLSL
jgi:hypothetical protein